MCQASHIRIVFVPNLDDEEISIQSMGYPRDEHGSSIKIVIRLKSKLACFQDLFQEYNDNSKRSYTFHEIDHVILIINLDMLYFPLRPALLDHAYLRRAIRTRISN